MKIIRLITLTGILFLTQCHEIREPKLDQSREKVSNETDIEKSNSSLELTSDKPISEEQSHQSDSTILNAIELPPEIDGQNVTYKPIIYLYPESTTNVNIGLIYDGLLTHTYPKYNGEWNVTVQPDGTIHDQLSKEYYALYWEGKPNKEFAIKEGHVVSGKETVSFLEKSLSTLGLNRREANEFIIYWLPKMENNDYNLIHFSTTEYEEMAQLNVSPAPDTQIRVMMVYQPLETPIQIKKQDLNAIGKQRKGFTLVEWGGHPLPRSKNSAL